MQDGQSVINLTDIGARIRYEREKHNLTRENFAEIVGLSAYYIGQIERGDRNMSIESLVKISSALNVSIDYILKGHIYYMENILSLEVVDENYKEDMDDEVKEILSLLSGTSKEGLVLVKDLIKLILPNINK